MPAKRIRWRDIPGYEGHYKVSCFGELRSLDRTVNRPGHGDRVTKTGQILSTNVTRKGYLRVQLSRDGVHRNHLVHRLVAITFLPPPLSGQQIKHKDGNKQNNSASNLEWVLPEENMRHAYRIGLKIAKVKYAVYCVEENVTTRGIDKMVEELRTRGYKVNSGGIWMCLNGRRRQHAGFTFRKAVKG